MSKNVLYLKEKKCTSSGSNIPLRVTIICLGCSSTGNERIKAATSSAVFHFANYKLIMVIG